MGYTHYWNVARKVPREQWEAICADALVLIKAFRDVSDVRVDEDGIVFNGTAETFWLSRRPHRSGGYCKTLHESYDKLACAVLMIAAEHSPHIISISSDACYGSQPDGWPSAAKWASKVLGRKIAVPWIYTFKGAMRGACYRTLHCAHLLQLSSRVNSAARRAFWQLRDLTGPRD